MAHANRYTFGLLAVIFIAPWLVALYLYGSHYTGSTRNQGYLIPGNITRASLNLRPCHAPTDTKKSWTLLYLPTKKSPIKEEIKRMQNFKIALGKYQDQLTLGILSQRKTPLPSWCSDHTLPRPGTLFYLLDPRGQLVLGYTKENWQKKAIKDLKHLLKARS